jgi:hypothetical protein
MFLTKHDLKLSYGIDLEIGAFHVDRKVPAENLYWKSRTIYVPSAPGYLFIPIFSDLLFRAGLDKRQLLNEPQLQINESILHAAALLEHGEINWKENVDQVFAGIKPHIHSLSLYDELKAYLGQGQKPVSMGSRFGTPYPSLNRADTYLASIITFDITQFDVELAIEAWYALMTYFLIMDDLADIKHDLKNNEENVLLDVGLDQHGAELIGQMIDQSIATMNKINPVMANRIDHKKSLIDLDEIIRSIRQ